MVANQALEEKDLLSLSVLALSSRFDGRHQAMWPGPVVWSFSTRSVESF